MLTDICRYSVEFIGLLTLYSRSKATLPQTLQFVHFMLSLCENTPWCFQPQSSPMISGHECFLRLLVVYDTIKCGISLNCDALDKMNA
jgi:hypothetical protein